MTTYRRTAAAPASINVALFESYADARRYSDDMAAHKPVRKMTEDGLRWQVGTIGDMHSRAEFVRTDSEQDTTPALYYTRRDGRVVGASAAPSRKPAPGFPAALFDSVYLPILGAACAAADIPEEDTIPADDAWQSALAPNIIDAFRLPAIKPKQGPYLRDQGKPARLAHRHYA